MSSYINKERIIKSVTSYGRKLTRNFRAGWRAGHSPISINACTLIAFGLLNLFADWRYWYCVSLIVLDLVLLLKNSKFVSELAASSGARSSPGFANKSNPVDAIPTTVVAPVVANPRMLGSQPPQTVENVSPTNAKTVVVSQRNHLIGCALRLLFARIVWIYVLSALLDMEVSEDTTWYDRTFDYLTTWILAPIMTSVYLFEPVTISNGMSYGQRFEFFTARWAYFSGYAALGWILLPLCWIGLVTPGLYVVYMSYISMSEATEHNRSKPRYARGLPYIKETLMTDPLEAVDSVISKHLC